MFLPFVQQNSTLLKIFELAKRAVNFNLIVTPPLVGSQVVRVRGLMAAQLTKISHSFVHLLFVKLQHPPCSCFDVALITIILRCIVFAFQVHHQHVIFWTHVFAVGTLDQISRVPSLVHLQTRKPFGGIVIKL